MTHFAPVGCVVLLLCVVPVSPAGTRAGSAPGAVPQSGRAVVERIDLAGRLASKRLRAVNREATRLDSVPDGVHVTAAAGNGVVWVEGTDVAEGIIEIDIRGKDVMQQSFVGLAFHGRDDKTYEAVYLRPFNFRATDPARHQHAVQYISLPDFDWPRLRQEFPEEFENPVDAAVSPTDWVPLRLVVSGKTVDVYVGGVQSPTLSVRKLGTLERGTIGLWVGNGSDGDFKNLRITPSN